MADHANIIETTGLTKRFSTATNYRALFRLGRQEDFTAVDAVDLQIKAGELFGLLGPNGAGKTTLVKMLCTLILPTAGRAAVAGHDVVTQAGLVRQTIGLINAEERSFFWRLTGRQNLQFFASLHNLYGRAANRRIDELLALVGLQEHADKRFTGYSTGMRQKLSVARGLLAMPPIILMDEPTRSLDPVIARDLRAFVRQRLVGELGRTVVLVTHRLEEAEAICDRVAIMANGRIVSCGPVANIKQQVAARHRYRLRVGQLAPPALDRLAALPGVTALEHEPAADASDTLLLSLTLTDERVVLPEIMAFLVGQGGQIEQCRPQTLSLEEAFVHLVQEQAYAA